MLPGFGFLRINHIGATNGWLKARPRQLATLPVVELTQAVCGSGFQILERIARLRDYPGAALRPAEQDQALVPSPEHACDDVCR